MTHLWDFLQVLLNDDSKYYFAIIRWLDQYRGIFKIIDPAKLAQLWGQYKNLSGMTYDKMSRSLRNYYKTKKLKKVAGQRQVYQFIFSARHPPLNFTKMDPRMRQFVEDNKKRKPGRAALYEEKLDKMHKNLKTYLSHQTPHNAASTTGDGNDPSNPCTSTIKSDIFREFVSVPLEIDIKEENLTE